MVVGRAQSGVEAVSPEPPAGKLHGFAWKVERRALHFCCCSSSSFYHLHSPLLHPFPFLVCLVSSSLTSFPPSLCTYSISLSLHHTATLVHKDKEPCPLTLTRPYSCTNISLLLTPLPFNLPFKAHKTCPAHDTGSLIECRTVCTVIISSVPQYWHQPKQLLRAPCQALASSVRPSQSSTSPAKS